MAGEHLTFDFTGDAAPSSGLTFDFTGGDSGVQNIDSSSAPKELGVGEDLSARFMSKIVGDPKTVISQLSQRLGVDPRRIAIRDGRPQVLVQGQWQEALPPGLGIADFVAQMGADSPVAMGAGLGAGVTALAAPTIPTVLGGMVLGGAGAAAGYPAKRQIAKSLYDDPTPLWDTGEAARTGLEGAAMAIPGMAMDRMVRRAGQFGAGSLVRRLRPEERATKLFISNEPAREAAQTALESAAAAGRQATPAEVLPGARSSLTAMGQAQPKLTGILSLAADKMKGAKEGLFRTGLAPVLGTTPVEGADRAGAQAVMQKLTDRLRAAELGMATDATELDVAPLRQELERTMQGGNLAGKAKATIQKLLDTLDKEGVGGVDEYTAQEAKDAIRAVLPPAGPKLGAARDAAETAAAKINALHAAAMEETAPMFAAADAAGRHDLTALTGRLQRILKTDAGGEELTGASKKALERITTLMGNDLDGSTKGNISQLMGVKDEIDDMISSALGGAEPSRKLARALGKYRGELTDFMEDVSPEYSKAMQIYRDRMGVKDDLRATLIGKMKGAEPERVLSLFKNADPERLSELSTLVPEHTKALSRANLESRLEALPDTATGSRVRAALLGTEKQRAALEATDPEAYALLNQVTNTLASGKPRPTTTKVGKLYQLGAELNDADATTSALLDPIRARAKEMMHAASPAYAQNSAAAQVLRQQAAEAEKSLAGNLAQGKSLSGFFKPTVENVKQIAASRKQLSIEDPEAWNTLLHTAISEHVGAVQPGASVYDALLGPQNNREFWKAALADRPGAFRRLNQFTDSLDNLDKTIAALERGTGAFGRRAEEGASKQTGSTMATLMRLRRMIISSTGSEEAAQSMAFSKHGPKVIEALLDPKNTEAMLKFREASKGSRVAARGLTTWLTTHLAEGQLNNPQDAEGMALFKE